MLGSDRPVSKFEWWWLGLNSVATVAASIFAVNQFGFGIASCYWTGVVALLFVLPRFGYNGGSWTYEKDSVSDSDRSFLSAIGFFFSFIYPWLILMTLAVFVVLGLVFGIQWLLIPEFRKSCKTLKNEE